ncbi:SIR2 family protein [Vibrio lentus]|uniref:SIR2 family protein n=1 Tax=Vibrio lentus TaxID=136468 RepID=UPI0010BDD4D4|nr:SIR2 family protein [Vibrio lentus]TKF53221.1 SIR2 family protein [Vibrio lentus]
MENYHDPIRHLTYLRQSLSQNNESIGFFLSAGCPLSVKLPEGKWPLIPDVQALTAFVTEQLKDNTKYGALLEELSKAEKNHKNIEDILSFLRSLILVSKGGVVRGLEESDLQDLEKRICSEIVKKLDVSLPDSNTPYHDLCTWIGSIDRKSPIELFTTNYDLLLEEALEDEEIPYFDGFVGSKKSFFDLKAVEDNLIPSHWSRLWKIHGSINWYQNHKDGKRSVFRSSEIKYDESHLIYPSHLKYEESRKMPYLALIDQLSRFVRKKSSLLILSGYSFNDGHLNDTIVNALKANPTGMVLGLLYGNYNDDKEQARYPEAYRLAKKRHNLNIWTFDKAIIGTTVGDWKCNSPSSDIDINHFITKCDENNDNSLVKLGDFSMLTTFLRKIIGSIDEE